MDLTLELIVRSGSEKAFAVYAAQHELPPELKTEKEVETGLYCCTRLIRARMFNDEGLLRYFSSEAVVNYLTKSDNVTLAHEMVKVALGSFTDSIEAEERIQAAILFESEDISSFVRKHQHHYSTDMVRVVEEGYSTLFTPYNMDEEFVNDNFESIDQFRDLIDPRKVVSEGLKSFEDMGNILKEEDDVSGRRYKTALLRTVLSKMIEMTDRVYVSQEAGKIFSGEGFYRALVKEGVIDGISRKSKKPDLATKLAEINADPEFILVSNRELYTLVKTGKDRTLLAQQFEGWIKAGRYELMKYLLPSRPDDKVIFDTEVARQGINAGIEYLTAEGDLEALGKLLFLPIEYVNQETPFGKAHAALKENPFKLI